MSQAKPPLPSVLADPAAAVYAMARYRRLLRLLILAMLGTVAAAAALIITHKAIGPARLTIALAIIMAFAMLLISALLARAMLAKPVPQKRDE